MFRSPLHFLAFGFGSGLSPRAPGTAGTVVALLLYLWMADWPLLFYSVFLLLAAVVGVFLCGESSRQLGVHDHPGIVWDEFVGFWLTMWAVPAQWTWIVLGFVVFRVLDIVKPWPIGFLDKNFEGGIGIMLDDIVAGLMACATLHLAIALVQV